MSPDLKVLRFVPNKIIVKIWRFISNLNKKLSVLNAFKINLIRDEN